MSGFKRSLFIAALVLSSLVFIHIPEAVNWLPEINTSGDFSSVSRYTTFRDDFIYATKYTVPASTQPGLLSTAFQNVNVYPLHIEFLTTEFPDTFGGMTTEDYINLTMRRATRRYYAGGFYKAFKPSGYLFGFNVYHDAYSATEELSMAEIQEAWQRLSESFHLDTVHYIPITSRDIEIARSWVNPTFPIHFPPDAPTSAFHAYSRASNYGVVRVLALSEFYQAEANGGLSWQDILVLPEAPTDIEGVVAGVITAMPQNELSHVNVRSLRRGTPNAYVRHATEVFQPLDGQLIKLVVGYSTFSVEPADIVEAEQWWEEMRPSLDVINQPDFSYTAMPSLAELAAATDRSMHASRFGGKATGLGKLNSVMPTLHQVEGFAIPMFYYQQFMDNNIIPDLTVSPPVLRTYSEYISGLITNATFRLDSTYRNAQLEYFREYVKDFAVIDSALLDILKLRIQTIFGSSTRMVRFRSSSNIEDSVEFNGAGLYNSTSVCLEDSLDGNSTGPSHCDPTKAKERTISRALRKVWASLWNFRAYEEREFFQVPQDQCAMGIAVTPAFLDEMANGVIFTGDPVNPENDDYLVNVQLGGEDVVQPGVGIIAEKDALVIVHDQVFRIKRLAGSSLLPAGEWVLDETQLTLLGEVCAQVYRDYPIDLQSYPKEDVLLDMEFKFDATGVLKIKQARPFVRLDPGDLLDDRPRVYIPDGACVANMFKEYAALPEEYARKSRIEFASGTYYLPLDVTTEAANWISRFEFGGEGQVAQAVGPGVIISIDNNALSYKYIQRFIWDKYVLELEIQGLYFQTENGKAVNPLIAFDEYFLSSRLSMSVTWDAGGPWDEYMRFGSCDYLLLKLWHLDTTFGASDSARIHLRWDPPMAGSGPARINSATAMVAGQARDVTSMWDLVYAADHHNWNERFWILFDQPIESIYGLEIRTPSFGGETVVHYLDAAHESIQSVTATGFTRTEIENQLPTPTRTPVSPGDLNASGVVDYSDLLIFSTTWHTNETQLNYIPAADFDKTGEIDAEDLVEMLDLLH
jgi:Pyruvate phosphate dikinase, AMP/ATP-binding domain